MSILEVMVAYTVFTIGLLGVCSFFTTGLMLQRHSRDMMRLQEFAQAILDESMETGYTTVLTLDGNTVTDDGTGETAEITVTQESTNLISVLVEAENAAGTQSVDLISYVSDR